MISKNSVMGLGLILLFLLVLYWESAEVRHAPNKQPSRGDNQYSSQTQDHWSEQSFLDYKTIRPIFWSKLYQNGGQSLYCSRSFSRGSHEGLNIEHVFPMSWVTNALSCGTRKQCRQRSKVFNQIEADLHNLYPSRTDLNQQRSSFRFAVISGESRAYGKQCDFEVDHRGRTVEPPPRVRGEIARSMFYMAYQYREQGLRIFPKQARLLSKWHTADPPDNAEKRRNTQIQKLQGNLNPFITNPAKLTQLLKSDYFDD